MTGPRGNKHETEPKNRDGAKHVLVTFVLPVLIVLFLTAVCSRFFYQLMLVEGRSMEPTYRSCRLVLIDRRTKTYAAGDVVAFRAPKIGRILVKRIAACPGDRIRIAEKKLWVNGAGSGLYPEDVMIEYAGTAAEETVLGPGEYFMLGDNLDESTDSRYEEVGIVREEDLLGRLLPQRRPAGGN